MDLTVTPQERECLRELAKKLHEIANLPVMKTREQEWYAHNEMRGERPMIIVETASFWNDMRPEMQCQSPFAQYLEDYMYRHIVQQEQIGDDCVCPDYIEINMEIRSRDYGFDVPVHYSRDSEGRNVGYEWDHPIACIEEDFHKLGPFEFSYNRESTLARKAAAEEILGDILPVKLVNRANEWNFMPTQKSVVLMGLENWMMSMLDEPEQNHRLMRYLTDNITAYARWQEENDLFTMNNGNHYTGAGSRGFTHELAPSADGKIRTCNLWGNMNSQESYSISPAQYKEFVFPYYAEFAKNFGLMYYGCCEPVHPFWKDCLETIPNLRKISISAWCNEEFMGEALRGRKTIFSRKPAPQYLGVGREFDEEGYTAHIKRTMTAARGDKAEFIFRDVYTLTGDTTKPRRAVEILRRLIETDWK